MNSESKEFLKPKIPYRFSCFIAKGDSAEDVSPEDTDSSSIPSPPLDHSGEEKKSDNIEFSRDAVLVIERAAPPKRGAALILEEIKQQKETIAELEAKEKERQLAIKKAEEEKKRQLVLQGYLPRDGTDPLVYSTVIGIPPKSFISTKVPYNERCPPPTYFSDQELYSMVQVTKEEILKGFGIPPEGGLCCTDREVVKRQSGVIGSLVGQMITSMGSSKLTMPVRIFEGKSMLERVADLWRFAPTFLTKAAEETGLNRFRFVVAFAVAGIYCSMQQLKPFNPLLGETLEASLSDGTKVYIEHTSHAPIIYNYLVKGPNDFYKFYGYHNFKMDMSPNTAEGLQDGPNTIVFRDGEKIIFTYPKIKLRGLLVGSRTVYATGVMKFDYPNNNLRAVIYFNHGKEPSLFPSRKKNMKIDDIEGIIYRVSSGGKKDKRLAKFKELKDLSEVVDEISGSWLQSLKISDKEYWNIDDYEPALLKFAEDPLPSDWRFREDMIWMRRKKIDYAQEWKTLLEAEQRRDRATRAIYVKKR